MLTNRYLPDSNRISVLTATVLLAFALMHLLPTSDYNLSLQLFGAVFSLSFNLSIVMIVLAAGIAATGMDWLLRGHPMLKGKRTLEHWMLPMLTTFVLGLPLYLLPAGLLWWGGFAIGAVLLILIFWAEYVVVSPGDTSYPTATAVLTVISFALYLMLTIALRYAGFRLIWMTPALWIATFLVSLRVLHLRLGGHWEFAWSVGIALISIQLAAGLHYWQLSPVRYGMLLLGPLYALISLAASLGEGIPLRRAFVEPVVMLGLVWGAGIWLH